MRSDEERSKIDGATLVNKDNPEVIEIWNNVFMEFNRMADGSLVKLPAQHVDTGMGFERLVRVIQGKSSNYDTDIFQFIIQKTAGLCNKKYGDNEEQDIAFRVIADHIRAVSLCVADGQLPANNGAGYVVRRILRRAVRYGYSYLGFTEPFLFELIEDLANYFANSFPELLGQLAFIQRVIKEEELSFFRTLSTGMQKINVYFSENPNNGISGEMAFELYDTYGFPIDLTEVIAREKNVSIDIDGFEAALNEQKQRSKADAQKETGDWNYAHEGLEEGFVGYDKTSCDTLISRFRSVSLKGKNLTQIVLADAPFYAESGGQVGDTGTLVGEDGEKIEIIDTSKENKLHILVTARTIKNPSQLFRATVNEKRRLKISANHSATHLMHSALQRVLGTHVAQKGSLVNDESLRFDFSHFGKMTDEELLAVESMVNEKIQEGISLMEHRNIPIQNAIDMGATALFGEKYGDFVRVIEFDREYSMELCGGTHVANTSQIGYFKLISEGSVSAGVRRIEAITNERAANYISEKLNLLNLVQSALNQPKDVLQAIEKLNLEIDGLQKKVTAYELEKLLVVKNQLLGNIQGANNVNFVSAQLDLPSADAAKQLCFQLKQEVDNLICVLGYTADEKPGLAIYIDEALVASKGLDAAQTVRECGKFIQGGGGGQKFFATAGGKDASGLGAAINRAKEIFGF
jgi:alanyl-tRNA synthetase